MVKLAALHDAPYNGPGLVPRCPTWAWPGTQVSHMGLAWYPGVQDLIMTVLMHAISHLLTSLDRGYRKSIKVAGVGTLPGLQ